MCIYLNYLKPLFYASNLTISDTYFVPCFSNLFVISLVILFWFSNLFPWVWSFLFHNIPVSSFYLCLNIDLVFLLRCSVSRSNSEKSSLRHVSSRVRCWFGGFFGGVLDVLDSMLLLWSWKKSPTQLNWKKKAPHMLRDLYIFILIS